MRPIEYAKAMNERYGALGFPPYKWEINNEAPITALKKPLSECSVSMLTSGGVSLKGFPEFNPDARNDFRLDPIPSNTLSNNFNINDNYYDHTSARKDINCILPLDRLRELENDKVIKEVNPFLWSGFMGRIYKRTYLTEIAIPKFIEFLNRYNTDILVAIPACPLDHQTIAMVCRLVEESGIPTVCVSTARDITALVNPPRTLFINFPLGNSFGQAGDADTQRTILRQALQLVELENRGGAIKDFDLKWPTEFIYDPPKASLEYQMRK